MANAERNPQRKIQVDVKRSSENGTLVVTTAFPQEIRKRAYLTEKDALDTVGEKRYIRTTELLAFAGGAIGGIIGAVDLFVAGVTGANVNEVGAGIGLGILANYFYNSSKHAYKERKAAIEELKELKRSS